VAESEIADLLREAEARFAGVQIGSYPFFREGRTGANFVIRSTDAEQLAACARALGEDLARIGREPVDGGI
jgi:molybdopterin-biosynthesis enzyme MoeA-like protein